MKISLILCLIVFFSCTKKDSGTLVLNAEAFKSFNLDSICEGSKSFILFKDKKIDFGRINKRKISKILIHFPYANIGHSKLVLLNADVSCNCMKTTYPIYPLAKGKVGVIEVLVDVRNLQGVFNKNIFIKSNAVNDVEIIRIKGVVE